MKGVWEGNWAFWALSPPPPEHCGSLERLRSRRRGLLTRLAQPQDTAMGLQLLKPGNPAQPKQPQVRTHPPLLPPWLAKLLGFACLNFRLKLLVPFKHGHDLVMFRPILHNPLIVRNVGSFWATASLLSLKGPLSHRQVGDTT